MLGRQNLGGRQQHGLITVLDGDHRRLRGDDGLAAADIALQQPVHGHGRGHVVRDFGQHLLLRGRGLEGQHLLHLVAHARREREGDAVLGARLRVLQRHARFEPEELFEDQAVLRRRAKAVEQPQVRIGCREVHLADRRFEAGQP